MGKIIFTSALLFATSCQVVPEGNPALELTAKETAPRWYSCRLTNNTGNTWVVQGFSFGVPNPELLVDFWNGKEWEDPLPSRCGTGLDPLLVEPGDSWVFEAGFRSSNLPGLRIQAWEVVEGKWVGPTEIVWWQSNQPLHQTIARYADSAGERQTRWADYSTESCDLR